MLKKFSVDNFKGFANKIVFDLGNTNNYGFNAEAVQDDCISKGIIYGINGCGKSNLGLALFDIIFHLTDKNRIENNYDLYLNLTGRKSIAEFEYEFSFDKGTLIYRYGKNNVNSLAYEKVLINDREVIYYDFNKNEGYTALEGSDTLNSNIVSDSPISRVKYVSNNAILSDNDENEVFKNFIDFVNHMLLFYSLDTRGYEGFQSGAQGIAEGIVDSGRIKEFEAFLKENGVDYKLKEKVVDGIKSIYCSFGKKEVDFFKVASTGTRSLALFFYWYVRMSNASFVFIDEFDAFYHYELSESVVNLLKKHLGVQIIATTHNTDLMTNDLLRPDCYYLMQDNKIKPISDCTEKELRKAHNLQKMYKAGAFNV